VVEALQALRGVAQLTAVITVAEVGDFSRFQSPRQLMSYLGLTSCEYSTGARRKVGEITKAGNSHLRRVLIEAAWARLPSGTGDTDLAEALGETTKARQGGLVESAIALMRQVPEAAWKRQSASASDHSSGQRVGRVYVGDCSGSTKRSHYSLRDESSETR
jgi:transposase